MGVVALGEGGTQGLPGEEDLAAYWHLLQQEYRASRAAPLSMRRALLVTALLNNLPDRVFEAERSRISALDGAEDLPAYRALLRSRSAALGTISDVANQQANGPRLELTQVSVPLEAVGTLAVEDFMVSLYNDHKVQRVVIATAEGTHALAHEVFAEAIAWWTSELERIQA